MENIKIRLPKCLSAEERKGIQEYHSTLLEKFAPASRLVVSNMIYMFRDKEKMWPYHEYSPWQDTLPLIFEEGTVNKALDKALHKVLTLTQGGCEYGDIALFFSRAYAISLHALNNVDTGNTLKRYLAIWDTTTDTSCLTELWGIYFSQLPTSLCKDICASMVYCILGYENENRPEQLLQDIECLLQVSQDGKDTLKVFQQEVANIGATEEPPTPSKPKGGRTKEYLFPEEQTAELAAEFVQILNNRGIYYNEAENPSPDERQRIYKVLISLIKQHQKSVGTKSAASMCRFLTTACNVLKPVKKNGKEANNPNFETEIRKLL